MKQEVAILSFALAIEQEGEAFFRQAAARVQLPEAKQLFHDLAEWESMHQQYIRNYLAKVKDNGTWSAEAAVPEFAQKITAYDIFYRHEEGNILINERTSDLSVLRLALFIETDLHNFYCKAIEHTSDPDGKRALSELAAWEAEHQRIIQEQYDALQKEFWQEMGFAPF